MAEDTNKSITLTTIRANNNRLDYTIVEPPKHGSLTGTGVDRVYTPAPNYIGTDSFTFKAVDGQLSSNVSAVTITVTEVNEAPLANADVKSVREDEQLSFPASDLSANDNPGEDNEAGQILNVTNVTATTNTHGNVVITNGQIIYTPDADYNGGADFDYQVCDNGTTNGSSDIKCATGKVTVTINSVNDNPVAKTDTAVTDEDTPVTIDARANDSDVDGDSLSLVSASNGAHGSVAVVEGKLVYTPQQNYNGSDSFDYTVSDGSQTAQGTVAVTINSVNDNPTTAADSAVTNEDTPVSVNVVSNDEDVDGDSLSLGSVGSAVNGTVSIVDGKAVFSPSANYHGTGSFTYTVIDGHGGTASGSVTVTVNSVNDNPVAINDLATTNEDTAVIINVLFNDNDLDGDQLLISSLGVAAKGTVSLAGDGKVRYVPNANANGIDSFVYSISDGQGGTVTATVSVTINPVNDAPVLTPIDYKTVLLGNSLIFTGASTDVDMPADTLSYSLIGSVPAGAAIDRVTGAFSWTPTVDQAGKVYIFQLRVTDAGGLYSEQRVTIGVAYEWSNLLEPISTDGSSIFKGGTIPVKFKLTGASAGIGNATARLYLMPITVTGPEVSAVSNGNSNTGNLFRYDATAHQYIYNLSTKGLTAGVYQLRIDLGDGVSRTVKITLQ